MRASFVSRFYIVPYQDCDRSSECKLTDRILGHVSNTTLRLSYVLWLIWYTGTGINLYHLAIPEICTSWCAPCNVLYIPLFLFCCCGCCCCSFFSCFLAFLKRAHFVFWRNFMRLLQAHFLFMIGFPCILCYLLRKSSLLLSLLSLLFLSFLYHFNFY